MPHPQQFGDWLRQRRRALDLTRVALAEAVGCSAALIAKIESGQRRPSAQVAALLARALHIADDERDAFLRLARAPEAAPPPLPAPESASAQPVPLHLPQPLGTLHGRDALLAELAERVVRRGARLLTLTGPPGVGKTRLALALARRVAPAFPDGVWFVPLAAAHEPAAALEIMVQTLDLQGGGVAPLARLVTALAARRTLLVLDNTEQVSAVARELAELLAACPGLALLVTSRERLRVRGEHVIVVEPLAVPQLADDDAATAGRSPAVALFVEAAQASYAPFALTDDNAATVAAICRRLEGLPLALELVAAASPALAPVALLEQLEQSLGAAGAAPRDLPPRQRSLRAALDWSYDLLDDAERQLLARCGIFASTWSLEAAEAICGEPQEGLRATLGQLVDKSLVRRQDADGATLYTMLEVVREYTRERLRERGELALLRERHTAFYEKLAAASAQELRGPAQQETIARLRHAHPELDAALGHLMEMERYEEAAQLSTALRRFWWMTAFAPQGRRWLDALARHIEALAIPTRADVFNSIGMLVSNIGEMDRARVALEQSLAYSRRSEDEERIGIALHNLGSVLATLGQYQAAAALLGEALEIDRANSDQWGMSLSLNALAGLHYRNGNWDAARPLFEESVALARAVDDRHSVALTLNNLGEAAFRQGDLDGAEACFAESLALALAQESRMIPPYVLNNQAALALARRDMSRARARLLEAQALLREVRDMHELVTNLRACALMAALNGSAEAAARLLGAAAGVAARHAIGDTVASLADIAAVEASARPTIGTERWSAHWEAGRALGDDAALEEVWGDLTADTYRMSG